MRKLLTDIVVKKAKAPAEIWDVALPGFGVRITPNGGRTYCVMYRVGEGSDRRQRRMKIGDARLMELGEAREAARAALQAAGKGIDPQAKVASPPEPERPTVQVVFDRYMAQYVKPNLGARSYAGLRAMFNVDVLPAWGERPIAEITKANVVAVVDAVVARGAPVGANRVHAAVRAFFNWAVKRAILERSPAAGTEPPTKENGRERVLKEREIGWFWQATGAIGPLFGTPFRLMLATAQRRDEVREMRWRELDLEKRTWTIPAARAKNGQQHEVALSDLAISLLETVQRRKATEGTVDGKKKAPDDLVFGSARGRGHTAVSGLSRAKKRLDTAMAKIAKREVEPFTLHDLRRTAATEMARLGVPPHVVDKILNHKTGTIRGVAAIYNKEKYLPQQREALFKWGRHLAALVGEGEPATVVELPGRKRA